jgi:hypothetical protein
MYLLHQVIEAPGVVALLLLAALTCLLFGCLQHMQGKALPIVKLCDWGYSKLAEAGPRTAVVGTMMTGSPHLSALEYVDRDCSGHAVTTYCIPLKCLLLA